MEENQLTSEEAQNLWNEEASKLTAGDDSLAADPIATAPETPQAELQLEPEARQPEQEEDPYAGLSPTLRAKLAQIDELAQANAQLLHHVKTTEGRVAAMQREAQRHVKQRRKSHRKTRHRRRLSLAPLKTQRSGISLSRISPSGQERWRNMSLPRSAHSKQA